MFTASILFYSTSSNYLYHSVDWKLLILRILFVFHFQKFLQQDFSQGIALFRYTIKNEDQFSHVFFAYFVSFMQIFITCIIMIIVLLLFCMAETAINILFNFAEIAFISKINDWIGMSLVRFQLSNRINNDNQNNIIENNDNSVNVNDNNINERMSLFEKIALINKYDLELVDDLNFKTFDGIFCNSFTNIIYNFPWQFIIPLSTLAVNVYLSKNQNLD